jgi:transposase-like protein
MNLIDIMKKYPTEKAALLHLEKVRWSDRITYPYCGSDRITFKLDELRYHCNEENRNFSVRAKTIFEETRLDIRKWFYAVALMLNAKKGMSAMQLQRDLGVSYKTTWYCAMRIRCAMADQHVFLHSVVQVDTAMIGGKPRKGGDFMINKLTPSKRGWGSSKQKLIVMVEGRRGGKAIARLIPNQTSETLSNMLKQYMHKDTSIVVTDAAPAYSKLDTFFNHIMVNHSEEYSKNGINLNRAEGFIGLLKRGLIGQYHKLSIKYLPFYLAEFTFRYNHMLDKKVFDKALELAIDRKKCMLRYKCSPNKPVKICDL